MSEEGLRHRGRRCIEPEAVFGQMKHGMEYKRFRHLEKDAVTMDFAFFAITFNIKKMCSKIAKQAKNGENTVTLTKSRMKCLNFHSNRQKVGCSVRSQALKRLTPDL